LRETDDHQSPSPLERSKIDCVSQQVSGKLSTAAEIQRRFIPRERDKIRKFGRRVSILE
jgi:hypothetical protein